METAVAEVGHHRRHKIGARRRSDLTRRYGVLSGPVQVAISRQVERGGIDVVAYRPTKVIQVLQAEHFEVTLRRDGWPMTVLGLTCAP